MLDRCWIWCETKNHVPYKLAKVELAYVVESRLQRHISLTIIKKDRWKKIKLLVWLAREGRKNRSTARSRHVHRARSFSSAVAGPHRTEPSKPSITAKTSLSGQVCRARKATYKKSHYLS
jgi:hypothetical protein